MLIANPAPNSTQTNNNGSTENNFRRNDEEDTPADVRADNRNDAGTDG